MLAAIMCSGLSRRMGENKLLMELNGKKIIEYVIESVIKSDFDEIVIIYADEELKSISEKYSLRSIYNPLRELGQSEAIKLAAKNINDHSGIAFFMGDQPLISSNTINMLLKEFKKNEDWIIAPLYGLKIGAPVIFPSRLKDEFFQLEGDVGGKNVINKNLEKLKKVSVLNTYEIIDVDDLEDFEKIKEIIQNLK